MVRVREGEQFHAVNRDNVGPPWVGGMTLLGTCETSDCFLAGCSANFVTYDFISGVKFFNIMTAGHCFPFFTQVVDGVGKPVGSVTQRFFADGVTADVEEIDIATGTQLHKIIRSDPAQYSVLALRTVRSTADVVCKSGITTDQTCSWDVNATNLTVNVCTDPPTCDHHVELRSQMRAVRSSSGVGPGDSGGPVYATEGSGVRAHGIVSAATADGKTMIYSFMSTALNLTDTFICTPVSCP